MRTSASAATTTPAGSSTASSASAFPHRPRLIHHERAAQEILAIAILNGSVRFVVIPKFRESESPRIARELVTNNLHRIRVEPRLR